MLITLTDEMIEEAQDSIDDQGVIQIPSAKWNPITTVTHPNQPFVNHIAINVEGVDLYDSEDEQHIQSNKEVTITSNYPANDPLIITPDTNYSSLNKVTAVVNVPQPNIEIGKSERITSNGIVNVQPDQGYDAMDQVRVNVAVEPALETKTITTNGTYTPSSGKDGFSSVTVSVAGNTPSLESKNVSVTENGSSTISPSSGYDGLSSVNLNVNVPVPRIASSVEEYPQITNLELSSLTEDTQAISYPIEIPNNYDAISSGHIYYNLAKTSFLQNGTYNIKDFRTSNNTLGFYKVTVNVPEGDTIKNQSLTITTSQLSSPVTIFDLSTLDTDNGYTGYLPITINDDSIHPNDLTTKSLTVSSTTPMNQTISAPSGTAWNAIQLTNNNYYVTKTVNVSDLVSGNNTFFPEDENGLITPTGYKQFTINNRFRRGSSHIVKI